VTAGLFAWLLRGIDVGQVADTAMNAAPGPFSLFLVLLLLGGLARAGRFWVLVGRSVPFRMLLGITLVRNLFVDLLPARLGELSYIYLLTSRAGKPVEEGVATLAISFLLDLVALSPLLLAALLVVGGEGRVPIGVAVTLSATLAMASTAAVLLGGDIARRLGRGLAAASSARWRQAASRASVLAAGLDRARQQGVLLPAFGLSLLVRLCKYGGAYCLVLSLMMPLGYSLDQLGPFRIFLGNVAAEVAAALPMHGLAGFGTYEAAWTLALEELGYPREHAVVSGLLAHAITQIVEYALGGFALLWLMRPGRPVV
jgi:uncharacterized membrane protein YbhN (UPF0104 family)